MSAAGPHACDDGSERVSGDFPGRGLASKWRELNVAESGGFAEEL